MGKIQKLDLFTSNRIAAGEVVENPASVIKELVENSIDAGSSSIYIEIKEAGLRKIVVSDNGVGIASDDCTIAFQRHATSKILNAGDLDDIATLGFRGEALSSIAAVSRVELTTSTALEEVGTKVVVDGGEVLSCERYASPNGTSIKVENLFYNTPARLKFLKKPAQEAATVNDIIARTIIANPDISLRFVQDGKEIYHSPGDGEISSVMYCVYGKDVINVLNNVTYEDIKLPISIKGVVSRSEASKPNRRYQSFIVNGRYVQSQLLSNSLQQAFGTRLMGGRFPMCALYIEVPFDSVDVNVHPNKLQIKFKEESLVASAMIKAVESSISIKNIVAFNISTIAENQQNIGENIIESTSGIKSDFDRQKNIGDSAIPNKVDKRIEEYTNGENTEFRSNISYENIEVPKLDIDDSLIREVIIPSIFQDKEVLRVSEGNEIGLFGENEDVEISFSLVGQIFSTYILVEMGENAYIIDQHAAHEKLLFDSLKKSLNFSGSQKLIVPYEIAMESIGLANIKSERQIVEKMGFEIDFLEGLIELNSIPGFFEEAEAAKFIEDLSQYLDGLPYNEGIDRLTNDKLATMACKRAIKGNKLLGEDEMKSLVKRFDDIGELNCPHGRPIIVKISKKEMDKSFKRIL